MKSSKQRENRVVRLCETYDHAEIAAAFAMRFPSENQRLFNLSAVYSGDVQMTCHRKSRSEHQ